MKMSNLGKRFVVRACIAIMACVGAMPIAAAAQAVLQVPTSNRVAGNTVIGYNIDYGSATKTDLNTPSYTAFDSAGNLYISDTGNNCVRKVDTTGTMSVVVGYEGNLVPPDTCNTNGKTISDIQGLVAPTGIAVDGSGNLFIADSGHNCIRELPAGSTGTGNLIDVIDTCKNYGTIALRLTSVTPSPTGLLVDPYGNLVVSIADMADGINQVVYHYPANNATTVCDLAGQVSAAVNDPCPFYPQGAAFILNNPQGLARDVANNYYLSDSGNACVRELAPGYVVSAPLGICASDNSGTTAIPNFSPTGITIGNQGYIYVSNANPNSPTVLQYIGGTISPTTLTTYAGTPSASTTYTGAQEGIAAVAVSLNNPNGLSVDSVGNVYVADTGNGIVRQLALNNQFGTTPVHTPGLARTLQFEITSPVSLTTTPGADFQFANGNNTCTGNLIASTTTTPTTCSVTLQFNPNYPGLLRSPITLTDSTAGQAYAFGLSGTGLGANALFIPGQIQTVQGALNTPSATVVSTAGDLYFAETNSGAGDIQVIRAGSNSPATFVPAGGLIKSPVSLALDMAQNLYVADSVANSIFKVDTSGNVTTFASGLKDPVSIVVDSQGNVYVAQDGKGGIGVWKLFAGGQKLEIAGQGTDATPDDVVATDAKFLAPSGLYLDANGVLYISDKDEFRVYYIDPSNIIHYFAGSGTAATSDPTAALGTHLDGPAGLIGDAAGDIYIADGPSNFIYVVFAGSNQNPGIEALVGTGTAGNSGDGGPADLAQLNNPVSLALDGSDDLFLVDAGNNSVREVNYQDPTLIFPQTKPLTASTPLSTQLWDSGNQSLTPLSNFQPADAVDFALVSPSGCPSGGSLLQGSTCELSYEFTPAAYGSYQTTATSNDNAVDNPQVITLIGVSPQPTLSAPPVTAIYGVAYTLSATVTSPGALPTGTISFSIGTQVLCAAANVPANGVVNCSPSPTLEDVGTYTVTVVYSGDSNYLALTQTTTLTVTPAPVTITAANASRGYDTPNPTLTGTVSSTYPFPPGQSITATYATTAVLLSPPGTYPITPTAAAGPNTLLSDYAITIVNGTLTITQNSGDVSINSPAVTAVYGTPYTLSSSITSAQSPAPTGTATFTIAGQPICPTATLAANGTATCSPSPTLENVGTYNVSVSYSGDTYYPPATSAISLTISPAPVTITAANASRQFNTPNPTFTGTITGVVPGQSITATYATTATQLSTPGNYPITPTAVAGPGTLLSNYAITLVNGVLTITQDQGNITVTSPNVSAVYGTAYTLATSVTSGQTPEPTGTVIFSIGGQALCPAAPIAANGTATCAPSPTLENAGSYTVTVTYSGDVNYLATTGSLSLTITPAPITIVADNKSRLYNTPNPVLTGTVTGSVPVGQSITATYSTTATQTSAPGTYPITPTAVAGPGTLLSNYAITITNGTLTITPLFGAATITAPPVTAVYGSPYTLMAAITSTQTPAPTGTVTFTIGGQPICNTATLAANGSVTCAPSPTLENVGSYTVTLNYSGDGNYPAGSTTLSLRITPAPATITAANATRPYNTPNPTFTGAITGVVAGQSITATYATTATQASAPGTYPITPTAVAGPGTLLSNYAITLNNGTLTITQVFTAATIAAPAVTSVYGTAYTLSASITSGQTPAPTGTATFTIGGQPICPTATLAANGSATCAPSATLENVGTYTVTVTYSGDANYPAGTTTLTLKITPAPVTITAASFSRVFDTPNPVFTGTVTGVVTGQSITATYTSPGVQTSTEGNYPIVPTAVAGLNTLLSNYAITLVNGILTITPPAQTSPTGSFTITATPPEQEIDISGSDNFPVTLTSVKNFTDNVTFSCSGLPEGATCSFAPGNLKPAANATSTTVMTITASSDNTNVPPGSFGAMHAPSAPGAPGSTLAWALTMLPIGFSGSAASILLTLKRRSLKRRGKRANRFARLALWLVPLALLLGGMSGCGASKNFKIYTVTITATDATYSTPVVQSTTVQLVLAR